MDRTDAQLLIASRDDPRAFRELYDRWADRLLAYFYRRVLDTEVAGDLLAETFAVAFERRRRFRDVGAPGAAWLYGIAAKELAHWFRRQEVERKAIRRLAIEVPPLDDESAARIEALADIDTSVGCYDRADMTAGVSVVSVVDGTPVQACRRVMGTDRPLVACADSAQVVVLPATTCVEVGLRRLPDGYSAARAKVTALHRAIEALETSDCLPPEALAERVQRLLDDSGWTGWRTQVRSDLSSGPCGTVTSMGGDGRRYIEGSFDPREKRVIVVSEPPRALMDLLYAPDGIAAPTTDATGERCYTVEGAKELARRRLAQPGRQLTFDVGSKPAETDIEGPRGDRLDEGCAIIVGIATTPEGRLLVELWR